MRQILIVVLVAMLSLIGFVSVDSAPDSGNIAVTAQLQNGTPDAGFKIYKAPSGVIDWGTTYDSMSFTNFNVVQVADKIQQWTSVDNFVVVVWANGMGSQYKIQTAGEGSFTGTPPLPSGSFGFAPTYAPGDLLLDSNGDGVADTEQGAMPGSATLHGKGKAITGSLGTWADVYTSENPGSYHMIQVHYGFPPYEASGDDPYTDYEPIPTTQPPSTYTGVTIKLRITAA